MPTATLQNARPASKPAEGVFQLVSIDRLQANPDQPRRIFDDSKDEEGRTSLQRLAASLKAEGVLQPLVVTPAKGGHFLIVCGERRYRAAKIAGLRQLPCVLKTGLSETGILEMALTENINRQDLSPIDEARAISTLITKCGYTQKQFGLRLGLSAAAISYKLGLLKLTPDLQKEVARGKLSATQGRVISQEVSRINGTDAPLKRAKVMQEVHRGISGNGGRLDTQATRNLARKAVDQVQGNSAPQLQNGHKQQAAEFVEALSAIRRTLSPALAQRLHGGGDDRLHSRSLGRAARLHPRAGLDGRCCLHCGLFWGNRGRSQALA